MSKCHLINNPVVVSPWLQQKVGLTSPGGHKNKKPKSPSKMDQTKRRQHYLKRKAKWDRNVEVIRRYFPHLPKSHAVAALTIARGNIPSALVLLRFSNEIDSVVHRCNNVPPIYLDLMKNQQLLSPKSNISSATSGSSGKVGIVIRKTGGKYQSTVLQ